jgi:hypothetical protein
MNPRLPLRAALALGLLLALGPASADPLSPLYFEDLSALSGGPVDFATPKSTLEKAAAAFVDVDGDGWDDLITLAGRGERFGLFLNRPDGTGARMLTRSAPNTGLDSGPAFARDGAAITAGDVDGDGDEDLFIGCSFNRDLFPAGDGENLLLLNDGNGYFTDVLAEVGLTDGDNTTAACVLFDMDLDGDLDLFFVNTNTQFLGKHGDGEAHLFRNTLAETGELRFVEETLVRGIREDGRVCWAVTAPDYDGDGFPDLLISHDMSPRTQLFRNDGTGRFTEVSEQSGSGQGDDGQLSTFGNDAQSGMGIDAGDIDNDGDLDIYITNIEQNPLYVNNGDSTFTELGETAGVRAGGVTWGCTFADFDLDGFLDLYVAGGDVWMSSHEGVVSFLFRNRGDGTFEEVWATSGMRRDYPMHREMGSAIADFDGDGRPDLIVVRAHKEGASPYLYRNRTETHGARYVAFELKGDGVRSNTSAIGARIRIQPRDPTGSLLTNLFQLREIAGSVGRGSRSSLVQTFGVGPLAETVDVEVVWPRQGALQERTDRFEGLAVGRRYTITETSGLAPVLEADASAEVAGGAESTVPVAGAQAPRDPTTLAIESGPAWAALERTLDGSWRLRVTPPNPIVAIEESVTLVTHHPITAEPIRQALTLTVRGRPEITGIPARRSKKRVIVHGMNFDPGSIRVLIDGLPSPKVKVKKRGREADGDGTVVRVAVPKSLRKRFRDGAHEVVVVEPRTDYQTPPQLYLPKGVLPKVE